jgi:hypothetical protein
VVPSKLIEPKRPSFKDKALKRKNIILEHMLFKIKPTITSQIVQETA